MKLRGFTSDDGILLLTTMIWGFNFIAMKLAMQEIAPLPFIALRHSLSLLSFFFIFMLLDRRWHIRRSDILRLAIIGFFGVTVNQLLLTVGLNLTSAANASFLNNTAPIFGLLMAIVLEKELVGGRQWLGVGVAMSGVGLMVAGSHGGLHFGLDTIAGDLLSLGGAITWAAYSVLARPLLKRYPPFRMSFYTWLIGVPLSWPITVGPALGFNWGAVSLLPFAMVIYAAASQSIGNVLWYRTISRIGTARPMTFMYLIPFYTTAWAVLLLHETITPLQVIGGLAALAGVALARMAAAGQPKVDHERNLATASESLASETVSEARK